MSSILPLYLNSIAPLSISGKIGSMNQVLTCLGVITAYALGFIITEDKNDQIRWRILIGFPILPCLLSIVSLKWLFPYDRLERHI
jgi:MFS family permease